MTQNAKHGPALTPRAKGDLAERLVPDALELACAVHDGDSDAVAKAVAGKTVQELYGLLVVVAAMVPVDQPVDDLLSWITWDAEGRPLPGMTPMLPQMPLSRAETRREYERLRLEGLTAPAASRALSLSVKTAWRYEERMYEEGDQDAA